MFITFSTFTTISYIPIEKRVPQNAQKAVNSKFNFRFAKVTSS